MNQITSWWKWNKDTINDASKVKTVGDDAKVETGRQEGRKAVIAGASFKRGKKGKPPVGRSDALTLDAAEAADADDNDYDDEMGGGGVAKSDDGGEGGGGVGGGGGDDDDGVWLGEFALGDDHDLAAVFTARGGGGGGSTNNRRKHVAARSERRLNKRILSSRKEVVHMSSDDDDTVSDPTSPTAGEESSKAVGEVIRDDDWSARESLTANTMLSWKPPASNEAIPKKLKDRNADEVEGYRVAFNARRDAGSCAGRVSFGLRSLPPSAEDSESGDGVGVQNGGSKELQDETDRPLRGNLEDTARKRKRKSREAPKSDTGLRRSKRKLYRVHPKRMSTDIDHRQEGRQSPGQHRHCGSCRRRHPPTVASIGGVIR